MKYGIKTKPPRYVSYVCVCICVYGYFKFCKILKTWLMVEDMSFTNEALDSTTRSVQIKNLNKK